MLLCLCMLQAYYLTFLWLFSFVGFKKECFREPNCSVLYKMSSHYQSHAVCSKQRQICEFYMRLWGGQYQATRSMYFVTFATIVYLNIYIYIQQAYTHIRLFNFYFCAKPLRYSFDFQVGSTVCLFCRPCYSCLEFTNFILMLLVI